jgi:putative oxidoreductase
MEQLTYYTILISRVLMATVFLLNGFGIIDQGIPAREMAAEGVPASIVPLLMLAGRSLEIVAGFALALGVYPRLAAVGLFFFLVPATFVSHSFWLAAGSPSFQGQLINFFKNAGIWGGLLFIAAAAGQPSILPRNPASKRLS